MRDRSRHDPQNRSLSPDGAALLQDECVRPSSRHPRERGGPSLLQMDPRVREDDEMDGEARVRAGMTNPRMPNSVELVSSREIPSQLVSHRRSSNYPDE
jgi:hypothetical protein